MEGIEFNGTWSLDSIGLPKGLHTGLNVSYIKGKATQNNGKETPINALSPWTAVYSLGYDAPSKRWGVNAYAARTAAKKPSDTVHSNDDLNKPWYYAKHSKAYTLFDLSAYLNIGKQVTLRAAAYNITNKQYYTWESLRSIREFGTVNRVDNKTHAGIQRFTSPGRSYNSPSKRSSKLLMCQCRLKPDDLGFRRHFYGRTAAPFRLVPSPIPQLSVIPATLRHSQEVGI